MSSFVNSNALLSYIPLCYLTPPFTITGHCFALRRVIFDAAGGFTDMAGRLDDDHELARRVRALGQRVVQTPLIYDVENHFASFAAYAIQMKRWFVFPQQMMVPTMSRRELTVMALGSLNQLLLPLLALLALLTRRRRALLAFGSSALLFTLVNGLCERLYLGHPTPPRWWPLALISALITPLQIVAAMLGRNEVIWRGQRLRVHKGGGFEDVE
jgi:ceramide glucosyltransferase